MVGCSQRRFSRYRGTVNQLHSGCLIGVASGRVATEQTIVIVDNRIAGVVDGYGQRPDAEVIA